MGLVQGADLPPSPPRPNTPRAASAEIATSSDLPGTTNNMAWMGPKYSPTLLEGAPKPLQVVEKMSDSPMSTVVPPGPRLQGVALPSCEKNAAGCAFEPGSGSL